MNVTRWTRFGKDRIYVRDADGVDISWWDLVADEGRPQSPDVTALVVEAVAQWRADHSTDERDARAQGSTDGSSGRHDPDAEAPDRPRRAEAESRVDDSMPEHEPSDPRPVEARRFTLDPQPAPAPDSPATPGPDFLPPPGDTYPGTPHATPASQQPPSTTWSVGAAGPVTPAASPATNFPPPQGPPVVADLLFNTPGQQLAGQIEAAHLNGQTPTLLRRFFLGKHAYSTWERGAIGERLVADELARLVKRDPSWGFINSIPVGSNGSDIDLVVIGPGGVFTINAEHHQGASVWVGGNTVMVNGTKVPYVRNSRFEAKRAGHLLSQASGIAIQARGVVVPVNAARFVVREQPADVHVVNRAALARFLLTQPRVLDADTIVTVFQYARLSSTWTTA